MTTIYADAVLATTGGSGMTNATGAPDATWTTNTGANSWNCRWSMENPGATLAPGATHTVSIPVRKQSSGGGNPTRSVDLYENGVFVKTLVAGGALSTDSATLQGTFTTEEISSIDDIEVYISVTGADPILTANDRTVQVESISVELVTMSTGVGGQTLPMLSQDVAAGYVQPSLIAQTLQAVTQAGAATHEPPVYTGASDSTLAFVTTEANGRFIVPGPGYDTGYTGGYGTRVVWPGTAEQTLPAVRSYGRSPWIEELTADAIAENVNGNGMENVLGPADGVWSTDTAFETWACRFSISNPTTPLQPGATHTVEIPVRRDSAGGTAPTRVVQLYDNGVYVRDLVAGGTLTTDSDVYTATFTTEEVSSGDNVEIRISVTHSGGVGSRTMQVESITVYADIFVPQVWGSAHQTLQPIGQSLAAVHENSAAQVDQALPAVEQFAAATFAPPTSTGISAQSLNAISQSAAGGTTAPSFTGTAAQPLSQLGQSGAAGTGAPGDSVILVAETFTRAHLSDLAGVHPEVGNDVFDAVGTWRVESNEAVPVAGNESHLVIPVGQSTGLTVSADILVGTYDGGLALFAAAGDNKIFLNYYGGDNSITLYRLEPGPTYTALAVDTYLPSDTFTLSADVTEDFWVIAKINGVELFRHQLSSADQAAFGTVQNFGLRGWSGGAKFDNLTISTLDVFATADASSTLPSLTQAVTGSHEPPLVSSSIDQTLHLVTQAAEGSIADPVDAGTISSILAPVAQTLAGAVSDPVDTGFVTSVLQAAQQSATGSVQAPVYDGVGDQTLPQVIQNATGETTRPIGQAAIFQVLQPVAQSASGDHTAPTYTGSAIQTLPALTQEASGSIADPTFLASTDQSLQALTQSAAGTVTDPVDTGTIAQSLPSLTQVAIGVVEKPVYTATAASTLAPVVQAAAGDTTPPVGQGYAFQDLQPVTQTATASFEAPIFSAAAQSALQAVAQSSSGTHEPPVATSSIDQTLSPVAQSASGATTRPVYTATATSTLPAVIQSASTMHDDPDFAGAANSTLQTLTQSATGTVDPPMSDGPAHSTLLPVAQAAAAQHVRPIYAGSITQGLQPVHQTALGEGVDPTSTGTAGSGLQPVAQTATATSTRPVWTGSIASSIPTIGQSATGQNYPLRTGAGVSTLPVVRQDASGIHTPVLITGTVAQALLPLLQSGSVRFAVVPDLLQDIITIYAIEQPITVEIVTTDPEAIIIYSAENESIVSTGEPEPHTIYAGIPVED